MSGKGMFFELKVNFPSVNCFFRKKAVPEYSEPPSFFEKYLPSKFSDYSIPAMCFINWTRS